MVFKPAKVFAASLQQSPVSLLKPETQLKGSVVYKCYSHNSTCDHQTRLDNAMSRRDTERMVQLCCPCREKDQKFMDENFCCAG